MDSALPNRTVPETRHCVVGTAGHIDHGKSTLVKALTGMDPDRLPEEQIRGMTLVLGFAHCTLPAPDTGPPIQVGFVDVPGHERLIKTMVAGATGFDLALLVVAADDGVMPQTREHVDILSLLGIETGLIAISKSDLVHAERLAEIRHHVAELVADTPLAAWPVLDYSVKTLAGLDPLRREIARLAASCPPRASTGAFRLPIDRAFSIHGRGLVVTGTPLSGEIKPGATLELLPSGQSCKVREVHSYGVAVPSASSGRRVALNLTGLDRDAAQPGMELATPGFLTPARYIDARVRLAARREKPVPSHTRVRVCLATREEMAVLVLLDRTALAAGVYAPAQLRFDRPVVGEFAQRFIFRSENAGHTLGGGAIIRPVSMRLRSGQADVLTSFLRAESPDPVVRVEEEMRRVGFEELTDLRLSCRAGRTTHLVSDLRRKLFQRDVLLTLSPESSAVDTSSALVHRDVVESVEQRALAFLLRHHAANPREPGLLRDRFITWLDRRVRPGLGRVLVARMESSGRITARGPYIAHPDFKPALTPEDADLLEKIIAEIAAARFDPPAWPSLRSLEGLSRQRLGILEDIIRADPRLVRVAPDRYLASSMLDEMKSTLRELGHARQFKLAEVRDRLQLSRRVVQTLLEHLDRVGYTRRVGDERVLAESAR